MKSLLRPGAWPWLAAGWAVCLGGAHALELDRLWTFHDPAASEQRFQAALASANADERLILQTQIARTHGLRQDFERARAVLAAIEPSLATASAEAKVRYHLELGRTYMSGRHPAAARTPEALAQARQQFMRADELAVAARLDGLAIDALHMMVFVDIEPAQQLVWNQRALARLEASSQPAAKAWEGSLRHNVGYALQLQGDLDGALREFRGSRAAYERDGRTRNTRIADWMIARTLRLQKQFAPALEIQLRLEQVWAAAGEPDPYVFEELAHLYRALGDSTRAEAYDRKLAEARAPKAGTSK